MLKRKIILGVTGAAVLLAATATATTARPDVPEIREQSPTGNVIFIHPDGTGPNHWMAGRVYWYGPDALSPWDNMPAMAQYRGHMDDLITGTSNGGATTHAFGYKVEGLGSFGKDGDGDAARAINSLSGYPGSILREALSKGNPVALVNDGDAAEPGTGAFASEVNNRNQSEEIVRQFFDGRPGFEGERRPHVIMGGGEAFFLPIGTPRCTTTITDDCAVHVDPVTGETASREDNRNLIREFRAAGYEIARTRAEFEALRERVMNEPDFAPNVLGLFAAEDIFNDTTEEQLINLGLVDPNIPADAKATNLILFGDKPGTFGYNPPTAAEMGELALMIMDRKSREARKPFLMVAEVESTDNFGNANNAIGTLVGVKHANDLIAEAQEFQRERNRRTMTITAADSDAGGMQIGAVNPANPVGAYNANPTGDDALRVNNPLDGRYGRGTEAFISEPDATGLQRPFAISWVGTPDVAGGIISRAQGLNSRELTRAFSGRFDNTDVYRMMYLTLFGRGLPSSLGESAPDR